MFADSNIFTNCFNPQEVENIQMLLALIPFLHQLFDN